MNVHEAFWSVVRELREGRFDKILKKNRWKLFKAERNWVNNIGRPGADDVALGARVRNARLARDASGDALQMAQTKAAARIEGRGGKAARQELLGLEVRKRQAGDMSGHRRGMNSLARTAKEFRAER